MKIIKKISLMVAVVAFGSFASAAIDYSVYVGIGLSTFTPKNKFDGGESTKEKVTYKNELTYNTGLLAYIKMSDMVALRTGVFISEKKFRVLDGDATTIKERVEGGRYLDFPVTLAYSLNRAARIYAGANVSFQTGNVTSGNELISYDNMKVFLVAGTVGGQFNVTDRLGIDAYGELGFGTILNQEKGTTVSAGDNKEIAKSPLGFGARVLYKF